MNLFAPRTSSHFLAPGHHYRKMRIIRRFEDHCFLVVHDVIFFIQKSQNKSKLIPEVRRNHV
jgi:hypothetical protein